MVKLLHGCIATWLTDNGSWYNYCCGQQWNHV